MQRNFFDLKSLVKFVIKSRLGQWGVRYYHEALLFNPLKREIYLVCNPWVFTSTKTLRFQYKDPLGNAA